jgi:hypothetical protein
MMLVWIDLDISVLAAAREADPIDRMLRERE